MKARMSLLALAAGAVFAAPVAAQQVTFMTGPQGGSWIPLGGALKGMWEKSISGLAITQTPGAGIANVRGVDEGKAHIGLSNSNTAVLGIQGERPYPKKVTNVCQLANLYPQYFQVVALADAGVSSLKDLKGAKIMSAPGPANVTMAKAALAAVGLKEGDYTLDQLDMAQHVNVMQAGTFDAGYTLEPNASTMRKLGIAQTIEAGVIAHYILGDPNANAFVGGCALTSDFIKSRPDVAKRFTAAWAKAVHLINTNPQEARKHLLKNTFTPEDVVDTVPMIRYYMAGDLTAKDKADFQKFIDFSVKMGTLPEKVDVTKYLQTF